MDFRRHQVLKRSGRPRYDVCMTLPKCKAIVVYGRDSKGNRSGLIPPRTCQRVAKDGDYCGLHARQAELQDLLRECFGYGWESKVASWEQRQQREREREGLRVVQGMANVARQLELTELAAFLNSHRHECAKVWGKAVV